ncbi:actin-binding Rho-activating protein-like [Branchiostoma lanceolatum]|uniref:actin-binding Rho-activating protein-like n=1 Tax=Branchiostoma lanceolatum TaxID=7740 RepID=UPI001132C28E
MTEKPVKKKPRGGVAGLSALWQQRTEEHAHQQAVNPFSEWEEGPTTGPRLHRGDEGYGRPVEGSKTEARGKAAHTHISGEVLQVVDVINAIGWRDRDGRMCVNFGTLFEVYTRISNKVVGVLMRARKYGLLEFEGEMLWQGRDNHVMITVLRDV